MEDPKSETSAGDDVEFHTKEEVISAATRVAEGDLWTDENLQIPMTWAGESTVGSPRQELPRLGGLGRPDSAYALLHKKMTSEEISALSDIIVYEIMTRQAIPGKNLKQGIATLIAPIESKILKLVEEKLLELRISGRPDPRTGQQLDILERKFNEIEQTMALRTQEELTVMEKATDVLAHYESIKKEEQAPGEELLKIQTERDELVAALSQVRETRARLPQTGKEATGKRSGRKMGLF